VTITALTEERALRLGASGRQWLADLPERVAELCERWSLTNPEPLSGGSAAYVARVRTPDGDAVLKIPLPSENAQVRTIAAAHGNGYVQLLAHDDGAMLLEALGPSLYDSGLPAERQIEILCRILQQAWQAPKPEPTPGPDRAVSLAEFITELSGRHPGAETAVAQALRYAERRSAAFDADRCVLVHGDAHAANALEVISRHTDTGYVLVDPEGWLAEPAYDCGVVLRAWCAQLLAGDPVPDARRWCRLAADLTGLDATAIWEWAYIERVSTGLYLTDLGDEANGHQFLQVAELLSAG
jgi:streptomycin 6-kinase